MRKRYKQFIFESILTLEDWENTYYFLDAFYDTDDLLGIEFMDFLEPREIVKWLQRCSLYDSTTMRRVRKFYAAQGDPGLPLYRMDDHMVMEQTARLIQRFNYPIVIQPNFESPRLETNTIDIISGINQGGSLAKMNESTAYAQAEERLNRGVNDYKQRIAAGKDEKIQPKPHHMAQANILQLDHPVRKEKLLPHSPSGWNDPQVTKRVLINTTHIIRQAHPETMRYHNIDHLIQGPVDEFIQWLDGAWLPPEQFQELLAAFTLGWLYKRIEKPAANIRKDPPPKPEKRETVIPPAKEEEEVEPLIIEFLYDDGTPMANATIEVELPSGSTIPVKLDQNGMGQIVDVDARQAKLTPVDVHADEWREQ